MNFDYLNSGYAGAIVGTTLGILGGAIGTYCSLAAARPGAERSFVVQCAIGTWVLVLGFVTAVLLLPQPYNHLLWIPYPIVLVLSILWMNRRQAWLRNQASSKEAAR